MPRAHKPKPKRKRPVGRDPAIDALREFKDTQKRWRAADAALAAAGRAFPPDHAARRRTAITVVGRSDGSESGVPYAMIECFSVAELRLVLGKQKRDSEIPGAIAAFETLDRERRAARKALGLDAFDDAEEAARKARATAWRKLVATRATSPAGIIAKLDEISPQYEGNDMLRSVRRDLAALARKKAR